MVLNLISQCYIATLIHQVSGREACAVQVARFPVLVMSKVLSGL